MRMLGLALVTLSGVLMVVAVVTSLNKRRICNMEIIKGGWTKWNPKDWLPEQDVDVLLTTGEEILDVRYEKPFFYEMTENGRKIHQTNVIGYRCTF
jgi:hypothetical protein